MRITLQEDSQFNTSNWSIYEFIIVYKSIKSEAGKMSGILSYLALPRVAKIIGGQVNAKR